MKLIIPMAGMGKRLRPHTLTVPKPLVKIAGKPIVQHLVEDIASTASEAIDEIAFIIGDFGKEVEETLLSIASNLNATGKIYYQHEALGTAHAILCAAPSLTDKTIVAFADTLFTSDFKLDAEKDGTFWVKQVDNPAAFGVVQLADDGSITSFVEKPETFVSDLAMIGIYYFKDGVNLKSELQYLIDNNIMNGGEYQLPDAMRNMTEKGLKFYPGKVNHWMDCGNKIATVETHQTLLSLQGSNANNRTSVNTLNSVIIEPCYIGQNVSIENSVIGPHVTIDNNSVVKNSQVKNSIIQEDSSIENILIHNSMVGSKVTLNGNWHDLSVGDYNSIDF